MKKNQQGFAILEVLLFLVFAALVVGIGWFVWNSNNKANSSLDNAAAANNGAANFPDVKTYEDCVKNKNNIVDEKAVPKTCTTKAGKQFDDPNPTAGWKDYSSKTGKYSLKHPKGWDETVCNPVDNDLTLQLGTTKATGANCDTNKFAQILVISTPAVPTTSEQNFGNDSYKAQTSKSVTVDGVKGTRRTAKLKVAQNGNLPKLPADTLAASYIFLTPGRSYIIIYTQTPSSDYAADNLAAFDYMVQNTLKFTK